MYPVEMCIIIKWHFVPELMLDDISLPAAILDSEIRLGKGSNK